MFYSLASIIDETTWQGILDQIPDGKDVILNKKPDLEHVHISWIVSQAIDLDPLSPVIREIAGSHTSFETVSGGLGVFPGQTPVLTFILARNRMMCELQSEIWERCKLFMKGINNNYSPEAWIPHITLLYSRNGGKEICNILERYVPMDIKFNIRIDNLSMIYLDAPDAGLLCRYSLL